MPINETAGTHLYIGGVLPDTDADLTASDFSAVTWVEVGGETDLGTFGDKASTITSKRIAIRRVKKAKGPVDAGTLAVVAGLDPTDAGQVACLAALAARDNYAFKYEWDDAPEGGTPTMRMFRGLVMGGEEAYKTADDEKLFNISIEVNSNIVAVVASSGGTAPANTVLPAITGTAMVGEDLTVSTGTWSGSATIDYAYQWYRGGVSIPGATAGTYTAAVGDVGDALTAEVTASNMYGSATAISAATADVSGS